MTKPGSPHDNGIAERMNGIFKEEWLIDLEEQHINVEKCLEQVITISNNMRTHQGLGNIIPNQIYYKGFLRQDTKPVIGKKYNRNKKAQPNNSNAIGLNDYSLTSCSSAEFAFALS
jgi:hypothetical protein